MIRTKLTYANVVATLALIVAVAGGSTAIAISSKQKISGKLIKPGTITTKQLKDGSITGPKLARIDRISVPGAVGTTTPAQCPQGSVLISGGVSSSSSVTGSTASEVSESWLGSSSAGQPVVTAMCLRATSSK
jgi:hypothetical protein